MFYRAVDRKRNGLGVILKEDYVKSVRQAHEFEAGNQRGDANALEKMVLTK